jgi:6-pyruvoyltetrahydropterin/6-carboxytetrahydropterin synthase
MLRLTREVRFAIDRDRDEQLAHRPTNSYGGFPSLRGFGTYLAIQVSVSGQVDPGSNYLLNIKHIDATVRERAIAFVEKAVRGPERKSPEQVVASLFDLLRAAWPNLRLDELRLCLSPFLAVSACGMELPMVRLSQKFEFSATHRLHNSALSAEENVRIFGKCNNPHGHGHNYEVQVTIVGQPDASGVLIDVPLFEKIVASAVIDRFDHKNLNIELPEFGELIPTVENIATVIYRLLRPRFDGAGAKLAGVTVWETPKTWCEYSED